MNKKQDRRKYKRVNLVFTESDYQRLSNSIRHIKVSAFIRKLVLDDLDRRTSGIKQEYDKGEPP
jgi:hypothetical protein